MSKQMNSADPSIVSPLRQEIARLGPWFHNLRLPDGTQTRPDHPLGDFPAFKWASIAPHIPQDLRGWRALDTGCNAGFYTFELARRGAQVTAIDVDAHYLAQARWAARQFGLESLVAFRQMQLYDLAYEPDAYDLVWFMGVFYHLRYPLLGIDIVAERVRRLLVFQTFTVPGQEVYPTPADMLLTDRHIMTRPGWPGMAFIEHRIAGDPTNWWAPNHACIEAMLRSTGMRVTARPADEVYVCVPDPSIPSNARHWNTAELGAATGRTRQAGQAGRKPEKPHRDNPPATVRT